MAKTGKATAKQLDFTKVKDGGMFSKRHQPPGDYPAKITKVVDAEAKGDGQPMWLFTIEVNGATYPMYCKLVENQLWKLRNLAMAAGQSIPKKRVKLDPNTLVGRKIAVTLEDEEYEGKMQSVVQATFPLSELDDSNVPEADEPAADADDEPKGKKSKKGKKGKKSKDLDALDIDDI